MGHGAFTSARLAVAIVLTVAASGGGCKRGPKQAAPAKKPPPPAAPAEPTGPKVDVPEDDGPALPEVGHDIFARSKEVEALAQAAGQGAPKVAAMGAALRAAVKRTRGKIVRPGLYAIVPPRRPPELALALSAGKPIRVHSFEAALLLVTAARAAGIKANLAEAYKLSGDRFADLSGNSGYYVAAVYDKGRTPTWVDPFGEQILSAVELADRAAKAAYLLLNARASLNHDPQNKVPPYRLLMAARRMEADPTATSLAMEATILTITHRALEAVEPAQKAFKLRSDQPRYYVLALAKNATHDDRGYEEDIGKALEGADLPPALLMQGQFYFETGKLEEAERIVRRMERAAPGNPLANQLRAQTEFKRNRKPAAERAIYAALADDPDDLSLRLTGFIVLRWLGKGPAADKLRVQSERDARNPAVARQLFAGIAGDAPAKVASD